MRTTPGKATLGFETDDRLATCVLSTTKQAIPTVVHYFEKAVEVADGDICRHAHK